MIRRLLIAAMLTAGLAAVGGPPAHAVEYNPCAQLDLSRIADNRNGVTYKYCWIDKVYRICGSPAELIKVRDWQEYQVGHKPAGCKNHW